MDDGSKYRQTRTGGQYAGGRIRDWLILHAGRRAGGLACVRDERAGGTVGPAVQPEGGGT